MKNLYLTLLLLFVGCESTGPKFQIGQFVSNGFCIGQVARSFRAGILLAPYEYTILYPKCGSATYGLIYLKEDEIWAVDPLNMETR